MFDHDEWMKRGAERQDFLEELKSVVSYKDDTCPKFDYELAQIIFHVLAMASGYESVPFPKMGTEIQRDAQMLFTGEILPRITKFSRSNEEQYLLMVKLYEWLAELITGQFISAFNLWESRTFQTEGKKPKGG